MAMDMALKNKRFSFFVLLVTSAPTLAGEWTFEPNISVTETYTNNVTLSQSQHIGSFVTQTGIGLQSKFNSKMAEFSLNANGTYASYSHDHQLDDDYRTLNAQGNLALWTNGPAIFMNSSISNISRNSANNSLADLVSGDTVESHNNEFGISYGVDNSLFVLETKASYLNRRSDDNIGENDGYRLALQTRNGTAARHWLWQFSGNYSELSNGEFDGKLYNMEAILGVISSVGVSPFLRLFDEDSTGNISGQRNTGSASWGPGLRWRIASHFYVDLSYNYPKDKTKNDNYFASALSWQPSARTSLTAKYSKRFFGDSYDVKFSHQLKRLTNSISYSETIQAFDRNNYQQINLGNFWCPLDIDVNTDLASCFVNNDQVIDFDNFQLVSILQQQLVEGNEFSLNRTLSWQSDLKLARTSFSLSVNKNKRESLTTNRIEDTESISLNISRKISAKSDIALKLYYQHRVFDQEQSQGIGQDDFYRTVAASYQRKLAKSLAMDFSINYLDRNSSQIERTYQETRALINITKDF
jgi:uncharacterized protein (PEP-CTERM system associated)